MNYEHCPNCGTELKMSLSFVSELMRESFETYPVGCTGCGYEFETPVAEILKCNTSEKRPSLREKVKEMVKGAETHLFTSINLTVDAETEALRAGDTLFSKHLKECRRDLLRASQSVGYFLDFVE